MSNEELHRLLPRYLLGKIAEADVDRFELHLTSCEECQAEKAFLETVQAGVGEHGEEWLAEHPAPERLVAYRAQQLSAEDRTRVRRHLDLCATCAVELRWISGEATAGALAGDVHGAPPRRTRVWIAAAAAAIVVAFLVPFTLLPRDIATRSLELQLISEIERADSAPALLVIEADAPTLDALFAVDLPAEAFPVTLSVTRADGTVIYERVFMKRTDLVQSLYASFQCSRSECRPGDYAVGVTSDTHDVPLPTPFRVEHRNR